MVDNVARTFAILQLIVGFWLFCFGIGELVVEKPMYLGIGAGIWVFITGWVGIRGTRREPSTLRSAFAAFFQCFSLISALLGGVLVGLYTFMIALYDYESRHGDYRGYTAKIAILGIILVLGILECCAGCGAFGVICCSSSAPPQVQVRYSVGSGYDMTHRSIGFSVASQIQVSAGPQGDQHQTLYRTSGYQPQRIVMPPPYEQGQCVTQQNQQASSGVRVAVQMQAGATFVADQTVTSEAQDNQPQIVWFYQLS